MFTRTNRTVTGKWIVKKSEDVIRLDSPIQRGYEWDNAKRSLLIHSMMVDFPVPPMFVQKETINPGDESKNQEYLWVLDGKQRISTIRDFMANEFKLSKNTPPVNGKDVSELYFNELDEDLKDSIRDYAFLIYVFDNMSTEERDEMFIRLNNGKPLSKFNLIRVEAGEGIMDYIRDLADNVFFDSCNITPTARARFADEELAMACVVMTIEDGVNGLQSKAISEVVGKIKANGFTDEERKLIEDTISYLNLAFPEKAGFLKKTNVPIIFHLAMQYQDQINPTDFAFYMKKFFKSPTEEYKESTKAGSAKAENIEIRIQELDKFIMQHINNNSESESGDSEEESEDEEPINEEFEFEEEGFINDEEFKHDYHNEEHFQQI